MDRKKRILVVCQYYDPEPFRISDICEEMVNRGYEVQVVTGYPNYPEGVLYDGYGRGKHIDEIINGVKVHRCFTIPRKTGVLYRFLNYFSFAISSAFYVVSNQCHASNHNAFDVVLCNQLSPIMMAQAAISYKRKYKVPAVMYCLDLWPESLIAGGIKRNSIIYKIFHRISKNIYRKMDKILITSRMFSNYLTSEFSIDSRKIEYLPQYAESIFTIEDCKKEYNDRTDLMFAGNIGSMQSVETIVDAAKITSDISNLYWHIVGDGSELNNIKIKAQGLKNVIFHDRQPLSLMPMYYSMADAMLVTMKKDEFISKTLPGKMQTYMAAGKPIIGAIDGEAKFVIEDAKCGLCSEAENSQYLAENAIKFVSMDVKEMGKNAQNYYEKHFTKQIFFDHVENILHNTVNQE